MATWICPFCRAKMSVKDSLLGQTKPCANCKQGSVVEDSSTSAAPIPVEALPEAYPRFFPKEQPVAAENLTDGVGSGAKIFLVIVAICNIAFGVTTFNDNGPIGFAGLLPVMLAWPLYTMAADTREILNRMKRAGK